MPNDPLCPQCVCITCVMDVMSAQHLRTLVATSKRIWNDTLMSLSQLPTSYTPSTKALCVFFREDHVNMHIVEDYAGGDKKSILLRLKNGISKKEKPKRESRLSRTGPSCACPDCGKRFISPYYLNLHLRNSGQKETCLTCGTVFIRGKDLKDHLEMVHKKTSFLCGDCPLLFSNLTDVKKHKKQAHKPGALTCGDCGRTFPRAGSFEAHSQMHAVRTCRTCGAQFANRSCYREHRSHCEPDAKPSIKSLSRNKRANIRDPATYTCDYCGKSYISRPQLKNHIIWIHMDVRPHQCQWCGKRFYTPARLAEHTIVHTRERNFGCDICGARLVSKMAAVYHRRRHTGEKPYACEDCGDRFISSSRRSEHAKRRHGKGERKHCAQCPASFIRGHELKKHLEKAHGSNAESRDNKMIKLEMDL